MKEKDGIVDYKHHQLILYVEKEDDTYGPVQTGSYISEKYFDDFLLKRRNLEETMINKLKDGEISPIYFYMTLEELSVTELAARTGISKYKVKKHLDPKSIKRIKLRHLHRYAEVFNISVANFFQFIVFKQDDTLKSYYYERWKKHRDQVDDDCTFKIEQFETNNPFFTITSVEEK